MKQFRFKIDGTLPNLNEYTNANRANRFGGANMKKKTEQLIADFICQHPAPSSPFKRYSVIFYWVEPNKRRDPDNVAFAKKFILDTLVDCGICANDGWNNVASLADKFNVDPISPHIEVLVMEEE